MSTMELEIDVGIPVEKCVDSFIRHVHVQSVVEPISCVCFLSSHYDLWLSYRLGLIGFPFSML